MDAFAADFAPATTTGRYPKLLSALYDPASLDLTYPELLAKCVTLADSLEVLLSS